MSFAMRKVHEVPILMTKTVSFAMREVHEVRTLEGQCFTQISISWLMMNIGQWRLKHTNMQLQQGHSVLWLRQTENNRIYTIGQICPVCSDHCPSKKWPTIPGAHKLNSQTELTIKPETCWNVAWQPVEKPQEQEPKCDPVHEKRRQPRKYEDTTSSLLRRSTSSGNPGLTMRFLTLSIEEVQTEELRNRSMSTNHEHRQARQLPQGKSEMGTERIPGQTEGAPVGRFSCFYFTWISDELPNGGHQKLGSFPHWSQNSLSSKTVFWCESWCCVPTATRSRSSTIYRVFRWLGPFPTHD